MKVYQWTRKVDITALILQARTVFMIAECLVLSAECWVLSACLSAVCLSQCWVLITYWHLPGKVFCLGPKTPLISSRDLSDYHQTHCTTDQQRLVIGEHTNIHDGSVMILIKRRRKKHQTIATLHCLNRNKSIACAIFLKTPWNLHYLIDYVPSLVKHVGN